MDDRDRYGHCTINFRDWVLGRGEFSPENTERAWREMGAFMGRMMAQKMNKWLDEALNEWANHDAEPAATAPVAGMMGKPDSHGTGNTQEPVAWAIRKHRPVGESPVMVWCASEVEYAEIENRPCDVIPLYRQPQLTLTAEERVALRAICNGSDVLKWPEIETVVRSLLERTK